MQTFVSCTSFVAYFSSLLPLIDLMGISFVISVVNSVSGMMPSFDLLTLNFLSSDAPFLPARRYASAGNSDHNVSVRPSVRLSVTRQYCVKTKKASGMISSPSGSPKTLVSDAEFHHQILRGSPRTGASNKGRSEKFSDFLALSVNISKTVTDTAKVTISD